MVNTNDFKHRDDDDLGLHFDSVYLCDLCLFKL